MATQGASNNEVMLAAAKDDNEELILQVFEDEGSFDINFRDGIGNTALHYAAARASLNVIEHILVQDECDVDLQNRLEGSTPLHLAVKITDADGGAEARLAVVESLLEAGADPTIKDKRGQRPTDYVLPTDTKLQVAFDKAKAQKDMQDDIANDSDGEPGSGSGSDND